jgi:SAM-dependent methyltransferase
MRLDKSTVDLFACASCGGALLGRQAEGPPPEVLDCGSCGASFPVVRGIPRFVSSENYAASFGMQWNRHRRTQLDSVTGLPISRRRLFLATGWPERLDGQTVLEAGSGAGRFTEILLTTGAMIYSFDYSNAVDANAISNGQSDRLCLFQADLFKVPVRKNAFDKVLCFGVLQHTPDPERAFMSLASHVKPGGQLAIDIYAKRITALVSWKYLLRPVTTRMNRERLYRVVERSVGLLLPLASALRRSAGRVGARLLPIAEHSHLGLTPALNHEWAVLDTFDLYSPAHDHPRSEGTVTRWFQEAGFRDVHVGPGPNGIVGRGTRV